MLFAYQFTFSKRSNLPVSIAFRFALFGTGISPPYEIWLPGRNICAIFKAKKKLPGKSGYVEYIPRQQLQL